MLPFSLVAGYLENGRSRGFVQSEIDLRATAQAVLAMVVGSMLRVRDDDAAARERYTAAAIGLMFNGVAGG